MKIKYYIIIITLLLSTIILFKVTTLSKLYFIDSEDNLNEYNDRPLHIIIPKEQREKYKEIPQLEKLLNIKPLLDTKDSLAIRVWFVSNLYPMKYLLEIKSNGNKWEGQIFIIESNLQNPNEYEITKKYGSPKNGWNKLMNKLNHYGIFVLPDLGTLESNIYYEGDMSYWVEVLNEKYYRFYTYNNPFANIDNYFECYYFFQITLLLETEFDIIPRVYL